MATTAPARSSTSGGVSKPAAGCSWFRVFLLKLLAALIETRGGRRHVMRMRTAGRRARFSLARGCDRCPREPLPDATRCPAHRWDGRRCQAPCEAPLGLEEPPGSQCTLPGFSSSYCRGLGFTPKPRGFNFLSLSKYSPK